MVWFILPVQSSVALGPDGKVYLAETDFDYVNKIHRIDPGGTISHISGTETTCPCRTSSCSCYAGDGEVPANARFWAPVALSVSANGQLIIADLGKNHWYDSTNKELSGGIILDK